MSEVREVPVATGDTTLRLHQLPIPAMITRDERCIAVNPAFCELTGIPVEQLLGRSITELISSIVVPQDQPGLDVARRNRAGGPGPHGEAWVRCLDGEGNERRLHISWSPGTVPNGRIVLFMDAEPEAFSRQVSDTLTRAAGQLSECENEEQVLERAVEAVSFHGFIAVTFLIEEGDDLLRYGPTSLPPGDEDTGLPEWKQRRLPHALLETLNPGYAKRRAAYFPDGWRLLRQAFPDRTPAELSHLTSEHRIVQAPLHVDDAPYGALVVIGRQLTPLVASDIELFAELVARAIENVRLRRAGVLRERLAALGEAAAVMAHEVRNPLAAILNALTVLEADERRRPEASELILIIREEADRLERLMMDLLELGRPLTPRARPVSLSELVQTSTDLLTQRGELETVHAEFPASSEVIGRVDPELAQLAMINILRNAVQAIPAGGRVRVTTVGAADTASVVVEDSGPGFSPEVLRRLGEPFLTTRATGTGLGLALVRRVMDASGGSLEVGRSQLGGARVALVLPRADASG
ncbi:MAG TPA: ATP-binding protein [Myxococcaceae bacterium]|nr:ATP-binding protein [Myxococcaceae bacterium]